MKCLITVWEEVTYSNKCKLSAEVPKMQMHLGQLVREVYKCEQGPPSSSYCPSVQFDAVTPREYYLTVTCLNGSYNTISVSVK